MNRILRSGTQLMYKFPLSRMTLSLICEFASISVIIPVIQLRLSAFGESRQIQLIAFAGFTLVALLVSAVMPAACRTFGTRNCARYVAVLSLLASLSACLATSGSVFLVAIAAKGAAASREVVSLLESVLAESPVQARRSVAETAIAKALGYTCGPLLTVAGFLCFDTGSVSQYFALPFSVVLAAMSVLILWTPQYSFSGVSVRKHVCTDLKRLDETIRIRRALSSVTVTVFTIAFVAGIASGTLYTFVPYTALHQFGVIEPGISVAFAAMGGVLVCTIAAARKLSRAAKDVSAFGKSAAILSIIGLLVIRVSASYLEMLVWAALSYSCVVLITLSLSMKLAGETGVNQSPHGFGARSAGYLVGQAGGSVITAMVLPTVGVAALFGIVSVLLVTVWPLFSRLSAEAKVVGGRSVDRLGT